MLSIDLVFSYIFTIKKYLNEESLIYGIIFKNRIFSYEKGFKLL